MSEPHNGRYPLSEKTSQTDDERIVDVTPLPPPEHLTVQRALPMAPLPSCATKTRGEK